MRAKRLDTLVIEPAGLSVGSCSAIAMNYRVILFRSYQH